MNKLIIRIKSLFIADRNKRKEFRHTAMNNLRQEQMERKRKNAKWGISYSVFDGEELLEASLKSVRKSADYINVVYQNISWSGKESNPDLYKKLLELQNKGLIDELILFTPDVTVEGHANENKKRNIGLQAALKAGCNYFMTMDTDEFYLYDEMEAAKEQILEKNITNAVCTFINYGLYASDRLLTNGYGIQFFSRINRHSKLGVNRDHVIAVIDPTRQLKHQRGARYFWLNCVRMHHMSLVRKDLGKKIRSTSYWDAKNMSENALRNKAQQAHSVYVPNIFDIPDELYSAPAETRQIKKK